jgi:16S rRNA (guanine527-N7)-methyltransferase
MTRPPLLTNPHDLLVRGCDELGISLDGEQTDVLMRYLEFLRQWNARVNLTAVTEPSQIVVTHFLDSLTVFKVMQLHRGFRVLDIGTGAGFPGVVLRIVDASLALTLLDRNPKKVVFLKYLVQALGLKQVTFLNVRLEDVLVSSAPPEYDVVLSRAFSSDPLLWDRLSVLVHSRGYMVRMTGPAAVEQDLPVTRFGLVSSWEGHLPFSTKFRRVSLYQRRD